MPGRPVWSGAISFGLVTIPISVVAATEDHSVRFHQYHRADMARVRTRKVCELEDREVSTTEIGKGYEVSKDTVVAISDAELEQLPLPTARAIEIVAFVPYESIDALRIGEGYYLVPGGQVAEKPYVLLKRALERSSKAAVAKFAWRGRERLGLLRVTSGVIALHSMRWPDEIRDSAEVAPAAVDVSDTEIDEAVVLIDAMTREEGIEGAEWAVDRYTQALEEVVAAKQAGAKPPRAAAEEAPAGQVVDLMAALEQSVQKAQAARGGPGTRAGTASVGTKKKAAAKKTAAKKTTTGKKTARKPRSA
ncbi:Ku protein [Streptomyces sp. Da 82-17]|uniref:non-homologous end joining protein Ku n=1 Tax=Streptomyces sp. Da 82-17 TaxID=3377116 RepID=UPI0038D50F0D